MSLFRDKHQHRWTEVGREYTRPRDEVEGVSFKGRMNYANQAVVARLFALQEQMVCGFTTVTYRCYCGRLSTDILTGRAVPPPGADERRSR